MSGGWEGALYLESGDLFEGLGFGAKVAKGGEAVFNTGLTGYQEIFTDPSYCKQIVVMTYPHIGNTGVNAEDPESLSIDLSGVVTREFCAKPSNWRSVESLHSYLERAKVPLLSDIDTRSLTQVLRDKGAQRALLFPVEMAKDKKLEVFAKETLNSVPDMEGLELVSQVSTPKPYEFDAAFHKDKNTHGTVVVYDYGVKHNTLRSFRDRGFRVQVVPYNMPHQEVMAMRPAAVVLSNGPGDPATVKGAVEEIQALAGKVPILSICMGHQLLARALGGTTFKLKFGHHGVNHPVKDLSSGRILITSQNHGFSVKADSLKSKDIVLSHVSLNDQTVEGFLSEKMKIYSVQFHPESKPGPNDAAYIFDHFTKGFLQ